MLQDVDGGARLFPCQDGRGHLKVADIFVSYTSSDREWAHWIADELKTLGHEPHVHEWEIKGGDDIYHWMEQRHDAADHVLCVVSDDYLKAPYSTLERNAALWQAAANRPGFVLLVVVKPCRLPTLSDHICRCELFGIPHDAARLRLREFMAAPAKREPAAFPGRVVAVANIPIHVPTHFMGRDEPLAAIQAALERDEGRVAITALHGLRGVGKTTLAAAYAERHRGNYRATWWIRAQTEPTMHADLVALGVRLGWVGAEEKEEPALTAVMERLRHEGEGILLIFDNAIDARHLTPYLPRGGAARILVTSNAHDWRSVAEPVEIRLWPKVIGADYLIARTGRTAERQDAEAVSEALGGLPLAHEQAAAYCERLDLALAEYGRRFAGKPAQLLDDSRHAPAEYHDGLTVAKTFSLAIEQAAKLHPAAEPLIVHLALLAPEPIPLFLLKEGHAVLGEPLAALLAEEGLDEAIAALRAFALVDRETIADEREPTVTTDTIRLHRLVREVAAARLSIEARDRARRALMTVLATVYPSGVYDDPRSWPPARRLDALALALVGSDAAVLGGAEEPASLLLDGLASYRQTALAAYAQARPLIERALAIREKALGPEHPDTATSLNNLARLLQNQGDPAGARPLCERALAIFEKALGPEHPHTATSLATLARLLLDQGDLAGARSPHERVLTIAEKALGPEHPETASSLNNLASLLLDQGDLAGARPLYERALAIREKVLGPEHPYTAMSLNNLARLLGDQGDLAEARPLIERALAIFEKSLGPEHPETAISLNNLAGLLLDQGDLAGARPLYERALAIFEKVLGPEHPGTATSLNNLARLLQNQGDLAGARPLYERALVIYEKALGSEHPNIAASLHNLARLLQDGGDLAGARPLIERALVIYEKALGPEHPSTGRALTNYAHLLLAAGDAAAAQAQGEAALTTHEKSLGAKHRWTAESAHITADSLAALGRIREADAMRKRFGID
jgi:tetratricopeptide (TPR) repeat protein